MDNASYAYINSSQEIVDNPRRRRTPSRYASSIKQLTKLHAKSSKKERTSSQDEDSQIMNPYNPADQKDGLYCILPGKVRKVKLSVIIRKPSKPPAKTKKVVSPNRVQEPQKKEREGAGKNSSLLDTLLEIVQKIQDDENQNGKQETNKNDLLLANHHPEHRRQYKIRKEKEEEEKYLKYYEKYQGIVQKLENCQRDLVLI